MSDFKYTTGDSFVDQGIEWTIIYRYQDRNDKSLFYTIENPLMPDKSCLESYLDSLVLNSTIEKQEESVFLQIAKSIGEMVVEKDKAYGNAALKPKKVFAKHHIYGARLDEKLARVEHSIELRKNDVADIMGGLMLICKDKGWTDFSDQID